MRVVIPLILCIVVLLILALFIILLCVRNAHNRPQEKQGSYTSLYEELRFGADGYNRYGYDVYGKNYKGQYNRLYDIASFQTEQYSHDGFLNPHAFPVSLTNHAIERLRERMGVTSYAEAECIAKSAYQFGKSARQIKKTSAALIHDIECRHIIQAHPDNKIVLVYKGYIYIFSESNTLITLYRNETIPL